MTRDPLVEKSCGAVVFTTEQDRLLFLLVQERSGFWIFPKGHMEYGESELETARREIMEETGLSVCFIDGFRMVDEHTLAREGHPEKMKQTVYFLALYRDQTFRPQEAEIRSIKLMDFDAALAALPFDGAKRILMEANAFLLHQ